MGKMKKQLSFLASIALVSTLQANNTVKTTSAYNGNTGVFETPNARIMPDWSVRAFLNFDKPYTYYGLAVTPLPFLELNVHVTEAKDFSSLGVSSSSKDNSVNLKVQVKKEGKFMPSIVLGFDDLWGSPQYSSKYIAMSKNIGYFDFTLGYAKGRLGGEDLKKYLNPSNSQSGFDNDAFKFMTNGKWGGGKAFGSVVFNATPSLLLLAEYSSIDYKKNRIDPFFAGKKYDLPKTNINFGLKYKYDKNSILSLSYQRGNTISFGYTYQFGLSSHGVFTHESDEKFKANEKIKDEYKNLTTKELSDKISKEVSTQKFENVSTQIHKSNLWLEVSNSRYNNDLKAVGRAISIVDEVAPKKYDTVYLSLKDNNLPIKTFKVNRNEFDLYEKEKVSDNYMKKALKISRDVDKNYQEFSEGKKDIYKTNLFKMTKFDYSFEPKVKTYLSTGDEPVTIKVSARANASYQVTNKIKTNIAVEYPLFNNSEDLDASSVEREELSFGSEEIQSFKYNGLQVPHLTATYIDKSYDNSFIKVEAGYLEDNFVGLDLEWYKSMFDDRFGIGLQYQYVYKREVKNLFKIDDENSYTAAFVNMYYLLSPKYDTHLGLKIGKFLAGDKGIRVDISRNYKDFTLGAFATITDSEDVFSNSLNKNYIDKGVFIKIPLEALSYKNFKQRTIFNISQYSRDVGHYAKTLNSLYPMNSSENNSTIMKKQIYKLKK